MTRIFVALLALASPAFAAPLCGPRDLVIAQLADQYGEARRGLGLSTNGAVVELYASDDGKQTWTVVVTMPNNTACFLASGQGWEAIPDAQLPPKGDPL